MRWERAHLATLCSFKATLELLLVCLNQILLLLVPLNIYRATPSSISVSEGKTPNQGSMLSSPKKEAENSGCINQQMCLFTLPNSHSDKPSRIRASPVYTLSPLLCQRRGNFNQPSNPGILHSWLWPRTHAQDPSFTEWSTSTSGGCIPKQTTSPPCFPPFIGMTPNVSSMDQSFARSILVGHSSSVFVLAKGVIGVEVSSMAGQPLVAVGKGWTEGHGHAHLCFHQGKKDGTPC